MRDYAGIEDIIEFAKKNDYVISIRIVQDLLKSVNNNITNDEINEICNYLWEEYSISVIPEKDEDYNADDYSKIGAFYPSDVNIIQRPMNINNILSRLENDEIDLYPDFQRNDNLWSPVKQSQLIESLMLRIPLPAFYFNAKDDNKWIVIDGLQRLTAFKNYLINSEKLQGLQFLKDFNDKTFSELPRQYIRRVKEAGIIAYTVENGTPESVVYNIFQRINTGGVILTPQEIRNALYPGNATLLTRKLANDEAFLKATQWAIHTERMQDREYINRYLAFTELNYKTDYKGNIDLFLQAALTKINQYSNSEIIKIEKDFVNVMITCYQIFGDYAFRKFNSYRRGPINKALFECYSYVIKNCDEKQRKKLILQKNKILSKFRNSFEDEEFNMMLKSGDQYTVSRRFQEIEKIFKDVL